MLLLLFKFNSLFHHLVAIDFVAKYAVGLFRFEDSQQSIEKYANILNADVDVLQVGFRI